MPRVLVPIADGSEEIEVVTLVDVLRRAEADVTLASVMPRRQVTASRGVAIQADCLLDECADIDWDLVALPGGMPGAAHLADSVTLIRLLEAQLDAGRWLGAICAAPAVVLGRSGLIGGFRATCHGAFREELRQYVREASDEPVVWDHNLITSRAPGTALRFSLSLVEALYGRDAAESVAGPMCVENF